MSDLVERVARAIYEEDDPWHKAWPWPDLQSDQAGVDQYRRIAQAAIAAMQTDAEPVAWMYERDGRKHVSPSRITSPRDAFAGWTETPLYAHPPVAAPTLKPAVEVWEDAYRAWDDAPTNPNRIGDADRAAAAVIEADRAAIIAAKDAEIAALREAAIALRDDMLMRAERDAWKRDGDVVVEAGAGVWRRFNEALGGADHVG